MAIGLEPTHPFGFGSIAIANLWIGAGVNVDSGAWSVRFANSIPTTGTHAVGAIAFNGNPSAGGKIGWVCTAAGTPGTWKSFGAIDA